MQATAAVSALSLRSFAGEPVSVCRQASTSSSQSPWCPAARHLSGPVAASSRRALLQQLAVCSAARPSRVAAATFQAPSVSFLPPASSSSSGPKGRTATPPKQHVGPPVFVKATGRIVASERRRRCQLVLCVVPGTTHFRPCFQASYSALYAHATIAVYWPHFLQLRTSATLWFTNPLCRPALPCPSALSLLCCVVAVGDVHGDLQKVLACLEMAGVLAEDDGHIKWVGGDATVVQLGDVLDRGDCEIGARFGAGAGCGWLASGWALGGGLAAGCCRGVPVAARLQPAAAAAAAAGTAGGRTDLPTACQLPSCCC